MWRSVITACLCLFTALSYGAAALLPRAALPPTQDPFYQTPENISSYKPGDIISSRETPGPIGAAQKYSAIKVQASYQLLYRTSDAFGNPVAAVCTIIVPHNPSFDKVLAYQTAYDSSDPNCSPSYTLQQQSNKTSYDPLFMAGALDQGWVISTADYEGLEAQFVSGLMSGQATLDSVRATLASTSITGVSKDATYALWGYSGGALASEWAIELQPRYAPDLHFAGAAIGGLTPDVNKVLQHVTNTQFSWQAFAGINGLAKAYPNVSDYIHENLIPEKAAEFYSINFKCTNDTDAEKNLENKDVGSYFKGGLQALERGIPYAGVTMGLRDTPTTPIFAYKAIGDQISPIADTDALMKKYCKNGARVQYSRNLIGEHVSEAILGAGAAFGWLQDRMNGVPAPEGCKTKNAFIMSLDEQSLRGFSAEVVGILALLLMLPLGPDSIKGI